MGDLVNLRTARKRARRNQAEQSAAANRLLHGSSKKEQNLERFHRDKVRQSLDQSRIEKGEGQ